MADRYVILVTAADGTHTVYGTTTDEYRATLIANDTERDDVLADVHLIQPLSELEA